MQILENDTHYYHFTPGKIYRKYNYIGKRKVPHTKLIDTDHDDKGGYKIVIINGEKILQHRILYEKFHNMKLKPWPEECIDHINGIKYDNRIVNLRLVTSKQNNQNKSKNKNNKSGHKNIHWYKDRNKWRVAISKKSYGTFEKIEDAINARDKAIIELNKIPGNIYRV